MTCLEIIKKYLKDNGFDGLVNVDGGSGCGCALDDLIPCGECFGGCLPAYKVMCPQPCNSEKCDGEHDYPECGGYLFCTTKDGE